MSSHKETIWSNIGNNACKTQKEAFDTFKKVINNINLSFHTDIVSDTIVVDCGTVFDSKVIGIRRCWIEKTK